MASDDSNSANGNRGDRLQVMLDGEELAALNDFRFKLRMPSRAAAVRELLKRGLAAEGFLTAATGKKSSQFGVVKRAGDDVRAGRGGGRRRSDED